MLCSRARVRLEGNQGSNCTKKVEQVVSGETGGGGERGTGSLERGKERKVWKRAQPGGSGVKRETGSGAGHTGLNAVL